MNNNKNFQNPFDDILPSDQKLMMEEPPRLFGREGDISKVSLWNPTKNNANVKVKKNEGGDYSSYAGRTFIAGDIVEVSPCKILKQMDVYSQPVRDLCFQIDAETYAIPFGYAIFYNDSINTKSEGNVDYQWDEKSCTLTFKAIKKIEEGEPLVINVLETDYP